MWAVKCSENFITVRNTYETETSNVCHTLKHANVEFSEDGNIEKCNTHQLQDYDSKTYN